MKDMKFNHHDLYEFEEPTRNYKICFYAWLTYFYETESYDRVVCKLRDETTREAVPSNATEYRLVQSHAVGLSRLTYERFKSLNIDAQTIHNARCDVLKYNFSQLEGLLAQYKGWENGGLMY